MCKSSIEIRNIFFQVRDWEDENELVGFFDLHGTFILKWIILESMYLAPPYRA